MHPNDSISVQNFNEAKFIKGFSLDDLITDFNCNNELQKLWKS